MVLRLFYKIVSFSVNDIYSNILTGQMCFSEKLNIPYFGHGPLTKRCIKRNKTDGIQQERDGEDGHGQKTVAFLCSQA